MKLLETMRLMRQYSAKEGIEEARRERDRALRGLFPGVRIRISNLNGVLTDADSVNLYYTARYASPAPCGIECPPGCDRHGWLELIPGDGPMAYNYGSDTPAPARLRIQVKPVMLSDYVGD